MPRHCVDIPDVYPGVVRPVLFSAAEFLIERLRLPKETQIYIPGDNEDTPMNGSSFNCCSHSPSFPSQARVVLRFTEEPVLDVTLTTVTHQNDNPPLFYDTVRQVSIRPIRKMIRTNCEITVVGQSRGVIQRMIDYIQTQFAMMQGEYTLQLKYHYTLPDVVVLLLNDIHKTIEASKTPLHHSFGRYFENHRMHPMLTLSTMTGTAPRIAVAETQEEVLGWFDFTDTPGRPERSSDEDGSYQITMNFGFNYGRPIQLYVEYPLLVHQKLLPKVWLTDTHNHSFYERARKVSGLKEGMDWINSLPLKYFPKTISAPEKDDWDAPVGTRRHRFFFQALLQIDKDRPRELLDINNMGRWRFGEHLTQYIKDLGSCVFSPTGIFGVELYQNNKLIATNLEFVEGKFLALEDLDTRYVYHIRFGIVKNLRHLSNEQFKCLRRYPHVFHQLIRFLRLPSGQIEFSQLPLIGTGSSYTEADCVGEKREDGKSPGIVHGDVVEQARSESNQQEKQRNGATAGPDVRTVMNLGIIARRANK